MDPTVGSLVVGLALLAVVFWALERARPGVRGQPFWRPDTPTDIAYWFFTPLVTRAVSRVAVIGAVIVLAAAAGVPLDREHVTTFVQARGRFARQGAAVAADRGRPAWGRRSRAGSSASSPTRSERAERDEMCWNGEAWPV